MDIQPRKPHRFGWRADRPDRRDRLLQVPMLAPSALPDRVDLHADLPPVYDQGEIGSCVFNSGAGAIALDDKLQQLPVMMASRLFWYWNTRYLMDSVGEDCGAEIRDALKVLAKTGVCHEEQWPYERARFATKPTAVCYEEATPHRALHYYRVPRSLAMLRAALARHMSVMFGMTLYESFDGDDVAKTGRVPMPGPDEAPIGGHAMLIVGYDDHRQIFLVRNSWGPGWGDPRIPGHCHIPYALVLGRGSAADFWVLERITG